MAVALHSNVGLMHGTMAIFNAWADRTPVLVLGAQGPVDATQRRPYVDWLHTTSDLGALVRGYTKWDNQPGSVPATVEAILRAYQIAMTPPAGPVFVCLDAALQEQSAEGTPEFPPLERFRPPMPPDPSPEAVAKAAAALSGAKRPLILMGRVSKDPADWDRRVRLAERLNARVVSDLKSGATFPTRHRLHPYWPSLFVTTGAAALIREADVILSLDRVDLSGTLRLACGGQMPKATIIQCSLDQYVHNGWSMDHQGLPPADISILAVPDRCVLRLLDELGAGQPTSSWPDDPATDQPAAPSEAPEGHMSIGAMARATVEALAPHRPCYIRLPLGWPEACCHFDHPLDYIGIDGGGGIGAGPGMAVGAAIALRGSGRLPVAVLGDGDYLMGLTAIWTAVHYRVPLLVIVANNASFFNDELHQERVANMRSRPVENRAIGLRMTDPSFDLAMLARGQGALGLGPAQTIESFQLLLTQAIEAVRAGGTCVIDARVAPEYTRTVSAALLRNIPATTP